MPLLIVRNDITKMGVDAIVNSTNEMLIGAGTGVDGSIHAAAGPELQTALSKIGFCKTGSAVITPSFGISSCSQIIHVVSPVYIDGAHNEKELLIQSYQSIFNLAVENGCRSIAMPVLACGNHGYPAEEAFDIAAFCARQFLATLLDSSFYIYLVLFSRNMFYIGSKTNSEIEEFITDNYVGYNKKNLLKLHREYNTYSDASTLHSYGREEKVRRRRYDEKCERADECLESSDDFYSQNIHVNACIKEPRRSEPMVKKASVKASRQPEPMVENAATCPAPGSPAPAPVSSDNYKMQDLSFGEMCLWWMDRKNISISEFYSRANITKAVFFNIKKHSGHVPRKTTAIACAIGLGLDLDQLQDLISRAGLVLSPYYELDMVVKYFVEKGNYNIDAINMALFERDLSLLGSA